MSSAAERARAAIARGDLIGAFDEAVSAIEQGDTSTAIRYSQVLALARMGDTDRAAELFETYGLSASQDPHEQAIGARIHKDRALELPEGNRRRQALRAAADAYDAIYATSGDSYPGINAASLAALGGDAERGERIARQILGLPEVADPGDFFMAATRAEAELLLRDVTACTRSLQLAGEFVGDDHGARSTTFRQLQLLARHIGLGNDEAEALLAPIEPARVIHFCGHIFASDAPLEAGLRSRIDDWLDEGNAGFAFGALAAGADLLIAEAVLARGAELNVVLPFAVDDFVEHSVRPAGDAWIPRFERCMQDAASLTMATDMAYVGDPEQFVYASRVAMGLAKLRAQHLGNKPLQLALWDGQAARGAGGTGGDVRTWRELAGESQIIEPAGVDRDLVRPPVRESPPHERAMAALLFTDFPGFSKLTETVLPIFWDGVMGTIADVVEDHSSEVLSQNSWGDALYAVASSAAHAAAIALDLQDRLRGFDYTRLGLENCGGMRIGAHYGPAYRTDDRITGRVNFYGTEVSRAARIEPVTPPGAVFVTKPFAAILALESPGDYRCRYVGRISLAKNYGTYPMYSLTRSEAGQDRSIWSWARNGADRAGSRATSWSE